MLAWKWVEGEVVDSISLVYYTVLVHSVLERVDLIPLTGHWVEQAAAV